LNRNGHATDVGCAHSENRFITDVHALTLVNLWKLAEFRCTDRSSTCYPGAGGKSNVDRGWLAWLVAFGDVTEFKRCAGLSRAKVFYLFTWRLREGLWRFKNAPGERHSRPWHRL